MCFYFAWDFFLNGLWKNRLLMFIKLLLSKGLLQGNWEFGLMAWELPSPRLIS